MQRIFKFKDVATAVALRQDGNIVLCGEKTGRVPKWADKLVRLMYVAHANGDEPIGRAIERARTVERLTSQRILVKESKRGWTPAIVDYEGGAVAA